jgi:hypothetical protein
MGLESKSGQGSEEEGNECHRREWPIPPIVGKWVVVRWWELIEDEEVFYEPSLIRIALRKWIQDTHGEMLLRQLCNGLWVDLGHRQFSPQVWETLLPRLEDEFRLRRLALVRQRSVPRGGGRPQEEAAAPLAQQSSTGASSQSSKKEKTWIAVRLIDVNGRPVPNERYRIVLPDRSTREGSLDEAGQVLVEQINPGQCDISFPDLDARDWSPA